MQGKSSSLMSSRPGYSNWLEMKKRCFNVNNKAYENYAGRGISVHADFINDFSCWIEEIGEKPSDGKRWSIGRIDNNGWYTYGNMRWETDDLQARNHSKQQNNTSGTTGVKLSTKVIAGRTYTAWVSDWADLGGKRHSKNFSIQKFGDAEAMRLATEYRNARILELNELGANYATSHGTEKVGYIHG